MNFRALSLAAAFMAASAAATPAFGSDKGDVLAVVNRYSDYFSKNDVKAVSLCTDHAIIIDDFAPHVWQGEKACADWWRAFRADNERSGIANGVVKLGKPWRVSVSSDDAYAVFPITFSFTHNGAPATSRGVWTFALKKLAVGWRIAGWAFALHA